MWKFVFSEVTALTTVVNIKSKKNTPATKTANSSTKSLQQQQLKDQVNDGK